MTEEIWWQTREVWYPLIIAIFFPIGILISVLQERREKKRQSGN
jgi:hypothetical protein